MSELQKALKSLDLSAIYWVDDEHATPADLDKDKLLEDISTRISDGSASAISNVMTKVPPQWRAVLGKIKRDLQRDESEEGERPDRKEQIKGKLATLVEGDNAEAILKTMYESLDGRLSHAEKTALTAVFEPLANRLGCKWQTLSFSDWERESDKILRNHSREKPALVLLDQQNTGDKSSLDGNTILSSVCGTPRHRDSFKFLVVTNTCGVEEELEHSVQLSKKASISSMGIRSPLFSMSKSRFATADGQPVEISALQKQFVLLLHRLQLSTLNQELTSQAKSIIEKASERAFARLTQITLHEFVYAVTQSSQLEGVSELDTLLRLIAIEQREAMLMAVNRSAKLRSAIERIRDIPIHIRETEIKNQADLRGLRNREVYWPEKALNRLHQPIAAGDIYEVRQNQKKQYYVLLGNDCDLMLRGDTGTRVAQAGLLAPFAKKDKKVNDLRCDLVCPLPQDAEMESILVNRFVSIPLEILDLCWLNSDGACMWTNGADYPSLHLLTSQRLRLAELKKIYSSKRKVEKLRASNPFALNSRQQTLKKVGFRIRRVGRINISYAHGVLSKFASAFARPSYEHDYTAIRDITGLGA